MSKDKLSYLAKKRVGKWVKTSMKKWIGLALLVLVVVGVVNSSKLLPQQPSPDAKPEIAVIQESKAITANAASEQFVNPLKVSSEKLLAHIRGLNYRRYTKRNELAPVLT